MSYSVNYLSKFSEDGYLYGKLVLFEDGEQFFVNHAKLDVYTGEIYSNAELGKYLGMLKCVYKTETYKNALGMCEVLKPCFESVTYPFVFIPYDVLEFHKITGFVQVDNNVRISLGYEFNDSQEIKFIPIIKDGVIFEFSNEI